MKIYVASSWRNPDQLRVVSYLKIYGHEVYDFRNPHQTDEHENGKKGVGFSWSQIDPNWPLWTPADFRKALLSPVAHDGYRSDSSAIRWCDVLICVPGQTAGRSMHLEAGYAAGLGKPVLFLLLEKCEPELMYKFGDIAISLEETIAWLRFKQQYAGKGCFQE